MTRRELVTGGLAFLLQQGRWEEAVKILGAQTGSGEIAAATLFAERGSSIIHQSFGKARTNDAVYLLASITKPMTATALMILVDRKRVSLDDPVQRFIPEFKGDGREKVLVRHILTHTSGLPDMLPENTQLRKQHAPLSEFVAATCRTKLLFEPGTEVRYQSMGLLLAGEIVNRVAKDPLPSFLQEQVFSPLWMRHTSLGLGKNRLTDTMQCQVDEPSDWDWNSSYWRNLASPWGGAHSTASDVALFLQSFAHPDGRVLKPATAMLMRKNQTEGMKESWGLGWRLTPETYGHSGSTGTLCWHNTRKDLTFVLLTTKPAEHSTKTTLEPVSNAIT